MDICSDLRDTMKAVPGRKFIALSAYTKKKLERSHTSNLTSHLRVLEQKGKGTQEE